MSDSIAREVQAIATALELDVTVYALSDAAWDVEKTRERLPLARPAVEAWAARIEAAAADHERQAALYERAAVDARRQAAAARQRAAEVRARADELTAVLPALEEIVAGLRQVGALSPEELRRRIADHHDAYIDAILERGRFAAPRDDAVEEGHP